MNKQRLITTGLLVFTVVVLAATVRGLPGTPTSEQLSEDRWQSLGPLELSPDRGRYALTYSLVEDGSWHFSLPIARFATPDLAINKGQYVSLFAPGLSLLIIPGYLIGKTVGLAQVGAFLVISLLAVLNVGLIRAIAIRLGSHPLAATIAGLVFLFATPAFTYAVSLYQHHASVFLMLLGVYALQRWASLWSVSLVWFLWALSVMLDSPNALLLLPVGIAALGRLIYIDRRRTRLILTIRYAGVLTFLAAVLPVALFLSINQVSYGDPLQLAGTLPSVQEIGPDGLPVELTDDTEPASRRHEGDEKTALGFFTTRNILNGLYVHAISPDRGMVWYAPVALLGIWGLAWLSRNKRMGALFVSLIGVNVLLYSMWGDPWGGWAFGSRYLIPTYALLAVGLAVTLSRWRARPVLLLLFFALLSYSVWVNTLGAVTSNTNPPRVEVLGLEDLTGQEQKYTYARNWDLLVANRSKSFWWQTRGKDYMSARYYHAVLSGAIVLAISVTLLSLRWSDRVTKRAVKATGRVSKYHHTRWTVSPILRQLMSRVVSLLPHTVPGIAFLRRQL